MNQAVALASRNEARSTAARERIQTRLTRFVRVRNRYDAIRGFAIGLACGMGFIWLIVVLDSTRWLSDTVRWGVIGVGYASSLALCWRYGIGKVFLSWFSRKDNAALARELESRCPHFRESLLASVGLRNSDGSIKNGSEVFLQTDILFYGLIDRKIRRHFLQGLMGVGCHMLNSDSFLRRQSFTLRRFSSVGYS